MFASEVAFLLTCWSIGIYRFKKTVRLTSPDSDAKPIERLNNAKRSRLETLFNQPSWKFLAIAKEIVELQQFAKNCRSAAEREADSLATKIYDPKSKDRLLNLITALLGLVVGLLGKDEGSDLLNVLSASFTWKDLGAIFSFAAICFFAVLSLRYGLKELLGVLHLLAATLWPSLHTPNIKLSYLVRDLVHCHTPMPPVQEIEQAEVPPACCSQQSNLWLPIAIFSAAFLTTLITNQRSDDNANAHTKNSD